MGTPRWPTGPSSSPCWGRQPDTSPQAAGEEEEEELVLVVGSLPRQPSQLGQSRWRDGGDAGSRPAEEMEWLSQRCPLLPAAQGCPRPGRGTLLLVSGSPLALPGLAAFLGWGDVGDLLGTALGANPGNRGNASVYTFIREPLQNK